MKKGMIKKIRDKALGLMILTGYFLGGVTIGTGGFVLASEITYSNHSRVSTINDISDRLNCIDVNMSDPTTRMQHNNGEPIYVSISSEIPQEKRKVIEDVLNYIFCIVGGINNNYYYSLIEDVNAKEYKNKASINIFLKEQSEDVGATYRANKKLVLSTLSGRGAFAKTCEVEIDPDSLYASEGIELYDIFLHEMLHVFGLNDVYFLKTGKIQEQTQINVAVGSHNIKKITPNDYKLLASMYHKPFKDDQEKESFFLKFNTFIEQYEKAYYSEHYKIVKKNEHDGWAEICDYEELISKFTYRQEIQSLNTTLEMLGDIEAKYFKLNITEGHYTLEVYNAEKKLLDKCVGEVCRVEDAVYLKGVSLNNFIYGLETYTDICLMHYSNIKEYKMITLGGHEYTFRESLSFLKNTNNETQNNKQNEHVK